MSDPLIDQLSDSQREAALRAAADVVAARRSTVRGATVPPDDGDTRRLLLDLARAAIRSSESLPGAVAKLVDRIEQGELRAEERHRATLEATSAIQRSLEEAGRPALLRGVPIQWWVVIGVIVLLAALLVLSLGGVLRWGDAEIRTGRPTTAHVAPSQE